MPSGNKENFKTSYADRKPVKDSELDLYGVWVKTAPKDISPQQTRTTSAPYPKTTPPSSLSDRNGVMIKQRLPSGISVPEMTAEEDEPFTLEEQLPEINFPEETYADENFDGMRDDADTRHTEILREDSILADIGAQPDSIFRDSILSDMDDTDTAEDFSSETALETTESEESAGELFTDTLPDFGDFDSPEFTGETEDATDLRTGLEDAFSGTETSDDAFAETAVPQEPGVREDTAIEDTDNIIEEDLPDFSDMEMPAPAEEPSAGDAAFDIPDLPAFDETVTDSFDLPEFDETAAIEEEPTDWPVEEEPAKSEETDDADLVSDEELFEELPPLTEESAEAAPEWGDLDLELSPIDDAIDGDEKNEIPALDDWDVSEAAETLEEPESPDTLEPFETAAAPQESEIHEEQEFHEPFAGSTDADDSTGVAIKSAPVEDEEQIIEEALPDFGDIDFQMPDFESETDATETNADSEPIKEEDSTLPAEDESADTVSFIEKEADFITLEDAEAPVQEVSFEPPAAFAEDTEHKEEDYTPESSVSFSEEEAVFIDETDIAPAPMNKAENDEVLPEAAAEPEVSVSPEDWAVPEISESAFTPEIPVIPEDTDGGEESFESLDLDDFLTNSDSSPSETQGADSFESLDLDSFMDDFNAEPAAGKPQEEELYTEEPIDIDLQFDDEYLAQTSRSPEAELELHTSDIDFDLDSVEDISLPVSDDIFDMAVAAENSVSEIPVEEMPSAVLEHTEDTGFTDVTDFDDVDDFNDILNSIDSAQTPEDTGAAQNVNTQKNDVKDYDLTVSVEDEDTAAGIDTSETETDSGDEDISVPLFTDDAAPESKQNEERPIIVNTDDIFSEEDIALFNGETIAFTDESGESHFEELPEDAAGTQTDDTLIETETIMEDFTIHQEIAIEDEITAEDMENLKQEPLPDEIDTLEDLPDMTNLSLENFTLPEDLSIPEEMPTDEELPSDMETLPEESVLIADEPAEVLSEEELPASTEESAVEQSSSDGEPALEEIEELAETIEDDISEEAAPIEAAEPVIEEADIAEIGDEDFTLPEDVSITEEMPADEELAEALPEAEVPAFTEESAVEQSSSDGEPALEEIEELAETIEDDISEEAAPIEAAEPVIEEADIAEIGDEDFTLPEEPEEVLPASAEESNIVEKTEVSEYTVEDSQPESAGNLAEDEPDMNFDDVSALEKDLYNSGKPETDTDSHQLLIQIAAELSSIRNEITSLKDELDVIKQHTEKTPEEITDASSGFFGDDEEDEAIALTGDELNNILINADFTEENGESVHDEQEENASADFESLAMEAIEVPADAAEDNTGTETAEELYIDESFPAVEEPVINFEETLEEPSLDDIQYTDADTETASAEEEIEIPITDEILVESDTESGNMLSETDEAEDIENKLDAEINDETLAYLAEASDDEIEELVPEIDTEVALPELTEDAPPVPENADEESAPVEELTIEELSTEVETISESEAEADENEYEAQNIVPAYEPDTSSDEDSVIPEPILDSAETPSDEAVTEEPTGITPPEEDAVPGPTTVKTEEVSGNTVPGELKDEIKSVLCYMDQLLENLPESKIEEFARSEHFDLYKKLFRELGLS